MKFLPPAIVLTLALLPLTAIAGAAGAVAVPWLFDVETPVANRSDRERGRAAEIGLRIVLQRLTGLPELPDDPLVVAALQTPTAYYSQFAYTTGADSEGSERLRLRITFDQQPLRRLLAEAGWPVWGRNRPTVVIWVAEQDPVTGVRRILGDADNHPLVRMLRARAVYRGIPLVVPVLDLDDQLAISAGEVWGQFDDALAAASRRYGEGVAIGVQLRRNGRDGLSLRWRVVGLETPLEAETRALTDADAARALVDQLAIALARRYAVVQALGGADEGRRLRVRVNDLRRFADYAELLDFMGSLDGIRGLQVIAADIGGMDFEVTSVGRIDQLQRQLLLYPRLVMGRAATAGDYGRFSAAGGPAIDLRFRFVGAKNFSQ